MNISIQEVLPSTALIICGVICALIGIFREISVPLFRIKLVTWQQAILIPLGLILVAAGVFLYPNSLPSAPPQSTCTQYKLKITSPRAGDIVMSEVKILGSYESEPPSNSIILINKQPEDPAYWPSSTKITLDPKQKTWSGDFFIGGNPPQKAEIIVGIMKESAKILYNYYLKVGSITGNWYPIDDFLQVIAECDRIPVTRGK